VIEVEKAIVQFGGAVKVFSSLLCHGFDAAESEKDGILKQVFQCSGSIRRWKVEKSAGYRCRQSKSKSTT
jgi:hypothetical protein